MRSYFADKFGSFDGIVMRDVEEPRPGPREVLIRIAASSLNFRDVVIVRGQYGGPLPKPGFVPLSDGAGEIAALGPLVRGFEVGDRVAGIFRQNWLGGRMPPDRFFLAAIRCDAPNGSSFGGGAEHAPTNHGDFRILHP